MSIESLHFEPKLVVSTLEDDSDYAAFLATGGADVRFLPELHGHNGPLGLASDAGDFAKWLKQEHSSVSAEFPASAPKVVLRSGDVWLPLVYLASDTSLQIFLNIAANYLYDKAKGALKSDQPRIHLSVVYQDKTLGKTKKFEFAGDAEALGRAIKRFDLNNFFDDAP